MPQGTSSRLSSDHNTFASASSSVNYPVASLFTNVPDILEFESWWSEGGQRRYMLILYYTAKEVFEVMVDDSTVPIKVAIYNRRNAPLQPWDLYVGVVLDILGKPTTLMKAKQSTMHWIDTEARRLWDRKTRLVATLEKFSTIPDLTSICGVTVRKLNGPKTTSLGGTIHLAKLATAVIYLQNELRLYRDV